MHNLWNFIYGLWDYVGKKKGKGKNRAKKAHRERQSMRQASLPKTSCFCLLKNSVPNSGEKYVGTNKIWMSELFWIKISYDLKKNRFLAVFILLKQFLEEICTPVLQNGFQMKMSGEEFRESFFFHASQETFTSKINILKAFLIYIQILTWGYTFILFLVNICLFVLLLSEFYRYFYSFFCDYAFIFKYFTASTRILYTQL